MVQRRNTILINPRFQLRYSLYVVTWLIPMIIVFPLITFEMFEYVLRLAERLGVSGDAATELHQLRKEVLILLVLSEISFIFATFLISLRLSHKIAGPVFKIRQLLQAAKQGDYETLAMLRRADHFQDLAQDYNGLIESIRTKRNQNIEAVSTLMAKAESAQVKVDEGVRIELQGMVKELGKVRDRLTC